MSQNYNHYIGPPHSSHVPHVPADQNLDSLSESLIHPGRVPSIQQNYSHTWPESQNWQNQRPDSYNYALPYQAHSIDAGSYFPSLQQQEFVPFEESEDSYLNEDQASHMVIGQQPMQPSKQSSSTSGNIPPHLQTRIHDLIKHQGQHRSTTKSEEQERASNVASDGTTHKPDTSARNDRAAELRAMLLAKRGSTPGTPSNQTSKTSDSVKLNTNDANSSHRQIIDSNTAESSTGKTSSGTTIETHFATNVNNKSPSKGQTSSSENADADNDIDGLLAEVRAAVAAEKIKADERIAPGGSAGKTFNGNENAPSTKGIALEKTQPSSNAEIRRQSLNKSPSSSDTSEGEIRSDSGKPSNGPHPSELVNSKAAKEENRPLDEKYKHEAHFNSGMEKQSAKRHDGDYSYLRGGLTPQAHSSITTKPYASSPTASQQRDQHHGSKNDYRRERYDRPLPNPEPRKEHEQDRRRELDLKERNTDPRRSSGFRTYGHDSERGRIDQHVDTEPRRPQTARYDVEENARAAAEYKKELEERRRHAARWTDKAEPIKDQSKKEIDAVGPRTPKERVNEAQQHISNNVNNSIDRGLPIRAAGGGMNLPSGETGDRHTAEGIEDVRDWLEMTGYADPAYRKTALARFRKIKALDLQRAELEREARLEIEGRSYIARSQSVLPRESAEPNTTVSPKILRTSILAMPPPPLPTKDTVMKDAVDDIGIKIKDSANREGSANNHLVEDDASASKRTYEQTKIKSLSLKRLYSDDESDLKNGRPSEKLSRIDSNGRSTDPKAELTPTGRSQRSLENRITRNEGTHERVRSRSPESRHRSSSPMRGRMSNYDKYEKYEKYMPRQRSRGSPVRKSGYSPDRQVYGHSSLNDKPRSLEKQLWCWNCQQSGHVSRDCTFTRKRRENEVKDPSYEESRTSPYVNKRNELKTDNDQESLYLGDYQPSTSRSFTGHYHQQYHSNNYRGRGRGGRAGYSYANNRGGYKPYKPIESGHELQYSGGSACLNLTAGDSRYFMIKSWNVENVETAQRDCIWATQEKNLVVLTEAYNTCRNVILVFSINNSRAFQGYARMASLPGEAPTPTWFKNLIWEATPPFHIKWITIAETRFNRVGHLKNAMNEGQAVLVGRDGQEIEGDCGRQLCEMIDEEGKINGWGAKEDQWGRVTEMETD